MFNGHSSNNLLLQSLKTNFKIAVLLYKYALLFLEQIFGS